MYNVKTLPVSSDSSPSRLVTMYGPGVLTVVLVVCYQPVSCFPDGKLSPHQLALQQHYQHLSYIAEYPCSVPQPRVVPVSHLLSAAQRRGKAYFPEVTVLHRCDGGTGCCDSGLHCGPLGMQPVHLPFKITFLDDTDNHRKGSWIMESHALVNHTACGCQEPSSLPVVDYRQVVPSIIKHTNYKLHVQLTPVTRYEHNVGGTQQGLGNMPEQSANEQHQEEQTEVQPLTLNWK